MRIFAVFAIIVSLQAKAPNLDTRVRFAYAHRAIFKSHLNEVRNAEFSMENLTTYLYLKGVKNKEDIMAQFILETGWFTSLVFLENNNLSGMKLPRLRETKAIGKNRGHAVYDSWADSVDDYLLWLDYHKERGFDTSDHLRFLEEVGYAEASGYVELLKRIKV